MSAAAEVHMCISGEGGEDDDAEGGDEMMYEYDFGEVELMMDDDGKAKVRVILLMTHLGQRSLAPCKRCLT